jgi:hypothetical protein
MSPLRLVLLLAVLIAADTAEAQHRVGRVRGVVLDSLLGDVLPGTEVRIDQLGRRVISDAGGRFGIDSVPPGEWTVAFRHPALDSLGFSLPAVRVRVFAGASASIVLSTPSFEPIRDRLCGETADSLSPTVAFGTVQTTDGTRVAVNVGVTWILDPSATGGPRPGSVRSASDAGRLAWVACGIPRDAWFLVAVQDSTRAASALVKMGPRGIAVHDLFLASGERASTGVVSDPDGRPVPNAWVSVLGSRTTALTNVGGRFLLPRVPNGTVTLDVRAAGYAPWVAPVLGGEVVQVRLRPLEAPNDAAQVRGSDYLRLLQRSVRPGVLLLTGAELSSEPNALTTLPPAGTCRWILDGLPVSRDFLMAQPRRTWRAFEVYPRGSDAPPEYQADGCAVTLLWTSAADW